MQGEWKILKELALEADTVDPIDWGQLNISEDEAFNLMAMHVQEMENNHLTLKAVCVKLMVENFVLNLKLMGKQ
jgi:mannitol/fructose-specific phosphotransferase system IIA component (Ntr-type)|tara:strand:+ start:296 stop:517 length:222 start_codon:yes stop_codon:yes gene_type:complete